MEAILSFLLGVSPWLAAIVIAWIAAWKLSKYHNRLEETNKKVDKLPCEDHRNNIETANERFKKLEETAQKVNDLPCDRHWSSIAESKTQHEKIEEVTNSNNDMLVEINKWIMKLDNDMIDKLAKKASPLRMTPVGTILFEQSHAHEAVDNNLEFLISELEEYKPQTAFDVEEKSLSVLLKNIGHEMFVEIKQYLYYSPEIIKIKDPQNQEEKEIKLSLQIIIRLMGLYLRDKYLEKYPDIK